MEVVLVLLMVVREALVQVPVALAATVAMVVEVALEERFLCRRVAEPSVST